MKSLNKFGLEILQKLNIENEHRNFIFSPYSAFVCTAMSISLFKNETRDEILKLLQIETEESQVNTIFKKIRKLIKKENTDKVFNTNKILVSNTINYDSKLFDLNENVLKIPIEIIEFQPSLYNKINNEVNETTNGIITECVDQSDIKPNLSMMLIDAICFQCDWEKKFIIDPDSNNPEIKNFTLADGNKIHVIMMQSFNRILPFAENDKFQVVSIPYLNSHYEFILILTKNETKIDFKELTYERLNTDFLSKFDFKKVDVKLPKFTIESKNHLNEMFQSLGMKMAFSELAQCEDTNNQYFINDIFQKAKIVIDEKGVEPQTLKQTMVMKCCCCCCGFEAAAPQIFANRPFAYLIRNIKTGSIIFEGFVMNPNE